jgi:hypothetical protein
LHDLRVTLAIRLSDDLAKASMRLDIVEDNPALVRGEHRLSDATFDDDLMTHCETPLGYASFEAFGADECRALGRRRVGSDAA